MKEQLENTAKALLGRVEHAANNDDVPAEVVAEMATAAAHLVAQIGDKKDTAGGTAVCDNKAAYVVRPCTSCERREHLAIAKYCADCGHSL